MPRNIRIGFAVDRKEAATIKKAAKAMDLEMAEFIRRGVMEKANRVASTEAAFPNAYREVKA